MFRFFFILWLVLPQTQGASQVYITHIEPWLRAHDSEIDNYALQIHDQLKALGAEYLARLLHYAREYAAHYTMGTEVRSYDMDQEGNAASAAANPISSDSNGSYLDSFFSGFKQPPAYSQAAASTNAGAGTGAGSSSTSNPPYLNVPTTGSSGSKLWSSVFKAGTAALQSSLHISPSNTNTNTKTNANSNTKSSFSNADFVSNTEAAVFEAIGEGLKTKNAGPAARSVSSGVASFTSSKAYSRSSPSNLDPPSRTSKLSSSSTSSLVSETDFDIIKHDETLIAGSTGNEDDENASLLNSNNTSRPVIEQSSSKSSMFRGWFKSKSEEEFPEKPVKLD